jgi:PIN domain nuclease of toxin-antitoxin system
MFLIDTHILIWALTEPEKLHQKEIVLLEDIRNEIIVSAASIWECAIKSGLGKLNLAENFEAMIGQSGFHIFPIDFESAWRVKSLPSHHGDPFDRLLIATAEAHHFTIVSRDVIFRQYAVDLF